MFSMRLIEGIGYFWFANNIIFHNTFWHQKAAGYLGVGVGEGDGLSAGGGHPHEGDIPGIGVGGQFT